MRPEQDWFSDHIGAAREILAFLGDDGLDLRGKTVADIGCGDGIIDLALAVESGAERICGFDIVPTDTGELLAAARLHGVAEELPPNLQFVTSETDRIPVPAESFDAVISWSAFEHISDPLTIAREIRRVLRPDGVFFLQLWPFFWSEHGSHLWDWFPDGFAQIRHPDDHIEHTLTTDSPPSRGDEMWEAFATLNKVTLDDLGRDLRLAGFNIAKVELISGTVHLPPEARNVPLSALCVGGVKLLATPWPPVIAAGAERPRYQNALDRWAAALGESPFFDADWYLAGFPEEERPSVDPFQHYLEGGAAQGRSPHPLFDVQHYLAQFPGDASARSDPLRHHLQTEAGQQASPHPLFDVIWYHDTQVTGALATTAWGHYVMEGAAAGLDPGPWFDARLYGVDHPDVAEFGHNPLLHYVLVGRELGAQPHPLFDADTYLKANPDLGAEPLDPYEHFVRRGRLEGRSANPLDTRRLARRLVDEGRAWIDDLTPTDPVAVIVHAETDLLTTIRCLLSVERSTSVRIASVEVVGPGPWDPDIVARYVGGVPDRRFTPAGSATIRTISDLTEQTTVPHVALVSSATMLDPECLRVLATTAERSSDMALLDATSLLAGPGPEATISAAGARVLRSGDRMLIGEGTWALAPGYAHVREIDAPGGDCVLVDPDALRQVGGLDDAYDDLITALVDLAFSLRRSGRRTHCLPTAFTYCAGGQRAGSEPAAPARFILRWADELLDQPVATDPPFALRQRQATNGTLLFMDDAVPQPDRHGGAVTTLQQLMLLAEHGFTVVYWPFLRESTPRDRWSLESRGIEVQYEPADLQQWLKRDRPSFDAAWVARPALAEHYLESLRSFGIPRFVYFTHDLHFLRERRRYEVDGDPGALEFSIKVEAVERSTCTSVDVVVTPSTHEAEIIHEMAPDTPVVVLPLRFRRRVRQEGTDDGPPLTERRELLFIGGHHHAPNTDAAEFMAVEILPRVLEKVPDARLVLVGDDTPSHIQALQSEHVEVVGWAPDLEPWYRRARMTVNPLRFGAGVKGKILESLERGVPVVTTTIGNEGIDLEPGVEALIADTPEEFAEHIVALYEDADLLRRLADAGRRFMAGKFDEGTVRDLMLGSLGFVFCAVCGHTQHEAAPPEHVVATSTDPWTCRRCSSGPAERDDAQRRLAELPAPGAVSLAAMSTIDTVE